MRAPTSAGPVWVAQDIGFSQFRLNKNGSQLLLFRSQQRRQPISPTVVVVFVAAAVIDIVVNIVPNRVVVHIVVHIVVTILDVVEIVVVEIDVVVEIVFLMDNHMVTNPYQP